MSDNYQKNDNLGCNDQGYYKQENNYQEGDYQANDNHMNPDSDYSNSVNHYQMPNTENGIAGEKSDVLNGSDNYGQANAQEGDSYHYRGCDLEQSSYQSRETHDSNYNAYEFSTPIDPAPVDDTIYANNGKKSSGKTKKEKKKSGVGRKFGLCIALAATFGLVAGGVFLGVASVGSSALGLNKQPESNVEIPKVSVPQDTTTESSAAQTVSKTEGNLTVAQVAESCTPAMVAITNKSIQEIPNYFGYGSQAYESESSGSGIIIDQNDTELLIATNNHVISGADSLTVAFVDGELVEAIVKGNDVQNDLAVVAVKISDIKEETLQQIKVIQIGDSDGLKVGEQVVAIGNALGFGQSVSSGYVSALDREVTIDNITHTLIQTDAAINPGNSGGALLNMRGELIGINEAKYSSEGVEGMGYAIPVSTATPILSELMSQETRYKVDEANASYMGVVCRELSEEFSQVYGVPAGAFIDSVQEDGPAEKAGIQKGDIIVKLDTKNISSYTDLVDALQYYAAGETVDVTVCRADNGEYVERTLTITLGEKPKE